MSQFNDFLKKIGITPKEIEADDAPTLDLDLLKIRVAELERLEGIIDSKGAEHEKNI